jgi:hypothetical protein
MKNDHQNLQNGRREFIQKSFSFCTLCCLAAPSIISPDIKGFSLSKDDKHKFLSDSGMSIQEVYDFAYKVWYIPAMRNLMEMMGREQFLDMLKKSSMKLYEHTEKNNIDYSNRTLKAWSDRIKKSCENWKNRLTSEIIKDNDNEFEIQFRECIWAKTFREAGAADIGYAGVCYQDYGMTKAFHPKLKLVREKTLMKGYDCCHFKWYMEG